MRHHKREMSSEVRRGTRFHSKVAAFQLFRVELEEQNTNDTRKYHVEYVLQTFCSTLFPHSHRLDCKVILFNRI